MQQAAAECRCSSASGCLQSSEQRVHDERQLVLLQHAYVEQALRQQVALRWSVVRELERGRAAALVPQAAAAARVCTAAEAAAAARAMAGSNTSSSAFTTSATTLASAATASTASPAPTVLPALSVLPAAHVEHEMNKHPGWIV